MLLEQGTFPKHGITSLNTHLTPPDEAERVYAVQHGIDLGRFRLACAAQVVGDVLILVPEESQARKQVVRKAASDAVLEVAPAVRLAYVKVEPAQMGGPGDWQRLQAALAEQWDLHNLSIDPPALRALPKALRDGQWAITATVWRDREVIRVEAGYAESLYGLAVDVGSTTVAGYLCNLRTGELLATEAMMNPQVRYGEDLMSRITYSMTEPQGLARMHRAILDALDDLSQKAAQTAGVSPDEIIDWVFVGNTVMHHLLLNIDPAMLGSAPFALATQEPVDLKARDLGLKATHPAAMIHILPCIAGYVGADNVGVLLAEQPHLDEQTSLIVDIGTNAEILLGNKDRLLSASSPTGPAFEGAQITHGQRAALGAIERVRIDPERGRPRYKVIGDERWSDELEEGGSLSPTGICGSGIIEAVAELFTSGLIDSSGLFLPDADQRSPQVRYAGKTAELILATDEATATGRAITITQQDIRAIQLAKAALYASTRLLMDRLGVKQVDRIKLAGAFGSYISPKHAMIIGLIPDCALDRVVAVGNSAGDGARIALLNVGQRLVAQQSARAVEYVETATDKSFQEHFIAALNIPHANDIFPHLVGILPAAQGRNSAQKRTR